MGRGRHVGGVRSCTARRVPPADDVAASDDVDADDSGLVGQPVVEQLLGGRVIDESDT